MGNLESQLESINRQITTAIPNNRKRLEAERDQLERKIEELQQNGPAKNIASQSPATSPPEDDESLADRFFGGQNTAEERRQMEEYMLRDIDEDKDKETFWLIAKDPNNLSTLEREVIAAHRVLARKERGLEIGEFKPDPENPDRIIAPMTPIITNPVAPEKPKTDEELAKEYWDKFSGTRANIEETMLKWLQEDITSEDGKVLGFHPDDMRKFCAYRVLAREHGYEISNLKPDPQNQDQYIAFISQTNPNTNH